MWARVRSCAWFGVLASAALSFLYALGGWGWLLGFVAFVPWLRALAAERTLAGTLLNAWLMSMAFTVAVFPWFASAIGHYLQIGTPAGLALLAGAAPLFQPQFIAFALVRHAVARRHGAALTALAAASAWVAAEWLVPKMLGDTWGYGLYPALLLRQAADVGGTAGLTFAALLANEAVFAAWRRQRDGWRAAARPLGLAVLVPLLLAGYGWAALSMLPAPAGAPLRVGLAQSNIADYERLRREKGVDAVVREVLDTHYEMSHDAVARHRADAVLWSETVYPTTFGHPKSEAGAELDREIQDRVDTARVPFVFGTYDRDDDGEYNAAAFVNPGSGLLGVYRKTRLFPFTEYLPAWLDTPAVRAWLPWAGAWRPGSGARVFPLRLADGRELPVLPLICRDDMDTQLAIDGARLGGQAIFTMSNDGWFTQYPQGAELHQAAAAFRSIETRLPQFRVTTTGYSAAIDAAGTVVAGTQVGRRTLVIGDLPVSASPPRTLMVAWGDWVGRAAAAFLALLVLAAGVRRWRGPLDAEAQAPAAAPWPAEVAVLPPAVRAVAGILRVVARLSLLAMAAVFLFGDGPFRSNNFVQIRAFVAFFVVPELLAWCVLRAFAARLGVEHGLLVFRRGSGRLELPLAEVAAVERWRWPVPGAGAWLRLGTGRRWSYGVLHADPAALGRALEAAGGLPLPGGGQVRRWALFGAGRLGGLDRPALKFGLFPLLLAIPAFRVHQYIAFGSGFGEYEVFGLAAYLKGFALWWAAWTIAVVVCAAVLRTFTETATLASVWLRPAAAPDARWWLERLRLAALYLGLPGWLLVKTTLG